MLSSTHGHHQQLTELLRNAFYLHQTGRLQEAENCCLKLCKSFPDQPDALHLLAIIHAQTKRFQTADDYFKQAIAAAPDRIDFLGNYANALWEQGLIDEAIHYCEQSLDRDFNQAEVHNILGNAYFTQSRLEAAVKSFRCAIQIHPHYPHALNNLGNALQRMNHFEEAITCYQQAIQLQNKYPEAYNNLGQVLKKIGEVSQSRESFQKALALRPDFAQAQCNYAEVDSTWIEPIEGKNLYLRRYQREDAAYLRHCYQNDAFMMQYNQYTRRHQHLDALADQLQQAHTLHPCQSKTVDWIILRKQSHERVGITNLVEIQFSHRRAEFLIGLPNPQNHTHGIGLEATLLVFDFAFNRVALNKLTAHIYENNAFSQQNALAIGFVHESNLREHILDPNTGHFANVHSYGMTLNDFRSNPRIYRLSQRILGRKIT